MHSMLKKDFWYDLPKELIAQEPASPRDAARLMVLSQKDDSIQHKVFRDLPEFLEPGDLLVVNNSKVLPARIVGVKQPTGAVCELLLLRQVKGDQWECLAKPGKRMQPGTKVSFGDGSLTAVVDETMEDGNKYVTFYYDTETLYEKLDEFGKMPLPPYITKQLEDQSQYQTVYAKELGSAAAPTAGLHFTPELMDTIRAMGVGIARSPCTLVWAPSDLCRRTRSPTIRCTASGTPSARRPPGASARPRPQATGSSLWALPAAAHWSCRCQVRRDQGLQRQHLHLPVPGGEVQLHRRSDHQLPSAGEHPDHVGVRPVRLRKDHARL